MNRITIISVFALFTAFAATGCFVQPNSSEGSDDYDQISRRTHVVAADEGPEVEGVDQPQQLLELNVHPSGGNQGPHPEPWLQPMGPHPEPWQDKTSEPSGNGNGSSTPKEP